MFKYTAVIIEPREHKALSFVLRNFFVNLSNEWGFIIWHGRKNKEYIQAILSTELKEFSHRIDKILQLDVDNLTLDQYSSILKNTNFYKCIDTEIFLIFQTDSIILSQNKSLLNNFLKYDYVGAPWPDGVVGNGGLSLRRKSKMIEICEKVNPDSIPLTKNEDIYFTHQTKVSLNRPSFLEAQQFSVETIFHEKSFGVHAPWKYINSYEFDFLINKYPELKTLMDLNL